jgi:hypothetical protein
MSCFLDEVCFRECTCIELGSNEVCRPVVSDVMTENIIQCSEAEGNVQKLGVVKCHR